MILDDTYNEALETFHTGPGQVLPKALVPVARQRMSSLLTP
jgi:hypothetical protein